MARGQLLKTKVKELKALSIAELEAQAKFKRDQFKKMWQEPFDKAGGWLTEKIDGMFDHVDGLELIATLGLTTVVHGLILGTSEWVKKAQDLGLNLTLGWDFSTVVFNFLKGLFVPSEEVKISAADQFLIWMTSFCIAFICVRHAGALIGGLTKGLGTIIPFFLGIG